MFNTMFLAGSTIPARSYTLEQLPALPSISLQCDVIFGAPSANCHGTGICKINGTNSLASHNQKKECRITKAILIDRPDQQGFSLVFFRSLLCSKLYRHHFWKGVLKVEEACALPEEIRSQLSQPFTEILPGNYAVTEAAGYFRVDVNCK